KIAVLGTEFNLNAYSEENRAVTTLIEGSVFVSDVQDRRGVTLRPGQQSIHDGTDFTTVQVDVALAKAWKDGIIIFNEADLKAVIQQIERWYDVTFEYQSLPKTETVYGQVSRNSPLSEILHSLEINYGVKFK